MIAEIWSLGFIHVACLAVQLAVAHRGMRRQRLYSVFFAAVALYQTVSLLALAQLVTLYGVVPVLKAELIALLGTGLLAATVMVGDDVLPVRRVGFAASGPFESVVARPGLYFSVVICCFAMIFAIMMRDGLSFMERTWQQARLESNYLDSLAVLGLFIVMPAAWVAVRARHGLLAGALLAASLLFFVVYGSRAALLTLPMAVVLDRLMRVGAVRLRLRTIVLVLVAAVGLHVLARFMRGFGLAGFFALLAGQSLTGAEILEVLGDVDLSGGEAAIFRYYLFAVTEGPFADIAPLTSLVRWLGIYVPGALLPSMKPVDLTYTLWWHAYSAGLFDSQSSFGELLKVVGAGGGGSLHPMIWGEMWLNGGLPAVPVYVVLLGVALLLVDAVYARVPDVVYVLAAPATLIGYVMIARGNSVIGLGYTAYVLPIAMALYAVLLVVRKLALVRPVAPVGKVE